MNIGILVSFMNNFGQKGFYNSQEIGMAKSLAQLGHHVTVYKLLREGTAIPEDESRDNISIQYSTVKHFGANGIVDISILDPKMDKLIYFADTQVSVPTVYKWCKKNKVIFIPYIGVVESHSTNKLFKRVLDIVFIRNIRIFNRVTSLAKTFDVKKKLEAKGVSQVKVAPVGIDFDLLNSNFEALSCEDAKKELGFKSTDKIVLLVGRIATDRNSLDSVEVFKALYQKNPQFRLLIIGKGELEDQLFSLIKDTELDFATTYIPQVPNSEMWKIYRASEMMITFSRTEIFGMSILEAMYYGTVVHAVNAPGPNDILKDHESGFLYSSAHEMEERINQNMNDTTSIVKSARDRVINQFSWINTAKIIEDYKF